MKYSVAHDGFKIEKLVPQRPEKVFKAFSDPELKKKWFSPDDETERIQKEADFRVGGKDVSEFPVKHEAIPGGGFLCRNTTYYLDIVENHRIVFSYSMAANGKPFSASLLTVQLIAQGDGTNIVLTEQGAYFENSDGVTMREEGWQSLMDRLAAVLK